MHERHIIWIDAATAEGCTRLTEALQHQKDLDIHSRVRKPGPLTSPSFTPSSPRMVLLELGEHGSQLLRDWTELAETAGIPLIVVGPPHDSQLMRRAMQAGARDYFSEPLPVDELVSSVRQIVAEADEAALVRPGGKLTSVIDAKGGSGASFVACNLAHMLTAHLDRKTALIDMDLQFGALPLALDMSPKSTLFDVIGAADGLDAVALRAYMAEHSSGLHVLGTMGEQLVMPWEVSVEAAQKVLRVALQSYAHVVTDLPRSIDPITSMVLSASDLIMVVMQRSFAHLRDAQRMFSLMRGYLGIPSERIILVVNRNEGKSPITIDDINQAIRPSFIAQIPNDFEHVTESMNLGVPLYKSVRTAPVTKALCKLAERVDGVIETTPEQEEPAHAGGIARLLGMNK